MLTRYFRSLYQQTMRRAYDHALSSASQALGSGAVCLDCGAGSGYWYARLDSMRPLAKERYIGIEWNSTEVVTAQAAGLDIRQADLNQPLAIDSASVDCVIALSVLEHLLFPCRFLLEAVRVLKPGGSLVLLTPNISTYFTAALVLAGRMPSSGPHPDSHSLLAAEELFRVQTVLDVPDVESDTPAHRHLVVFSYLVLRRYLQQLGLEGISGRGFGLYPFPNVLQPVLERLDPYHCHQMVFVARKT